jgi:putative nucleotidyltransferase with HDIG domain
MAETERIIKVFLCSTFIDLTKERKLVLETIRRLKLQHDSMEFFGARSKLSIKTCLEEVRNSDVLIVIVGHRYGNLVPRRKVSFSEAEYREAHRQKKPCLVYIRKENARVRVSDVETDPIKLRLLEKWKKTLRKRHTACPFRNPTDLAIQVAADLSRLLYAIETEISKKQAEDPEQRRVELEQRAYVQNLHSLVAARTDQLRQAMSDLERSYDITLEALGDALDLKDAESEGHSKRVTSFTIALARGMRLSGNKIRVIARGAFLHDIGRMAIPDTILRKPGALTEAETEIMREHPLRGYQILKKIEFLSEAAEIVYSHEERFDGTGYPRGLKGDEIPLGARIFAVADALDRITSDHPAQTIETAREEIESLSGSHFDPAVVDVFLQMPPAVWEDLRKEINSQIHRLSNPITSSNPAMDSKVPKPQDS